MDKENKDGVSISIGGNVDKSNVMGANRDIHFNSSPQNSSDSKWEEVIGFIYEKIDNSLDIDDDDKTEAKSQIKKIESELKKGDKANESKIQRWFKFLIEMTPDIFDVAVSSLANPILGVGDVVRKIASKLKDQEKKQDPQKEL